jgi:hypothetical protein
MLAAILLPRLGEDTEARVHSGRRWATLRPRAWGLAGRGGGGFARMRTAVLSALALSIKLARAGSGSGGSPWRRRRRRRRRGRCSGGGCWASCPAGLDWSRSWGACPIAWAGTGTAGAGGEKGDRAARPRPQPSRGGWAARAGLSARGRPAQPRRPHFPPRRALVGRLGAHSGSLGSARVLAPGFLNTFFLVGLGFELVGLCTYKADALPLEPVLLSVLLWLSWRYLSLPST